MTAMSVFCGQIVIALVASFISGDLHSWQDMVKNSTAVIAISQLVYQYLTQRKPLVGKPAS